MTTQKVLHISSAPLTSSTSPRDGEAMLHHGRPATTTMRDAHLSISAKCLYALLTTYANKELRCRPSRAQLAEDLGCSMSAVSKWLAELEKHHVIERRITGGGTTIYTLVANRISQHADEEEGETLTPTGKGGYTEVEGGLHPQVRGVTPTGKTLTPTCNRISISSGNDSVTSQEEEPPPKKSRPSKGGLHIPTPEEITLPGGLSLTDDLRESLAAWIAHHTTHPKVKAPTDGDWTRKISRQLSTLLREVVASCKGEAVTADHVAIALDKATDSGWQGLQARTIIDILTTAKRQTKTYATPGYNPNIP